MISLTDRAEHQMKHLLREVKGKHFRIVSKGIG